MDPGSPSPPSAMKMMRMMGDTEVKDAAAEVQRTMCDENIEFTAANLMAILRARGNTGLSLWVDRIKEMEKSGDDAPAVHPSTHAQDHTSTSTTSNLFGRVLEKFRSGSK
ncbi:hypothetical protein H4R19_003503 [Coemansia spiralis]|nr:hypothetical protein H4R19_003503 [Coemansia spiralis]